MGLFSNDKKPCPLCGKGTPKLLATKIADKTPICSDCSRKVSMENSKVDDLTLEELKEHFVKREENANYIKDTFRPNRKIEIGYTNLNIDEANQVFTIPLNMCGDTNNPPVFKFEELMGYELHADNQTVESFHRGDPVPQYVSINYRTFAVIQDKDEEPKDETCSFTLVLFLSNPCWERVESSAGSVRERIHFYHQRLDQHLNGLRRVTTVLQDIMGQSTTGGKVQNNVDSIADDIIKFKELLDGGVITQEEFNAKKKQLLGI